MAMATLDEIKNQIGQLQLEHSNKLTELQTLISPISDKLNKIEKDIETIKKNQTALTTTQAEQRGILIGAKWMIVIGLGVLTICGGVAGAVVGELLNSLSK